MPVRFFVLLAFVSQTLWAAEGGIEVWYFQQPTKVPAVSQQDHPGNTGGDAEVNNRHDVWRIDGMSLDSSALHVGTIDVTVTADLKLKKRVVVDLLLKKIDQTIVLADLRGVGVRIHMKRPVSFAMPETIELKCVQHGGQAVLELTDTGKTLLKDHFSRAMTEFLSPKAFDANFDHSFFNLTGPAALAFNLYFDSKKNDLLAELRAHLATEMAKPGYFDTFLKDIARTFPIPLSHNDQTIELVMDRRNIAISGGHAPVLLPENTWVVREKNAPGRFLPSTLPEIPRRPVLRPSATIALHSVRLSHLVADYFAHLPGAGAGQMGQFSPSSDPGLVFYAPGSFEREEIAKWISSVDAPTDSAPSRVLGLEIAGPHAPVLQPWYLPAKDGAPQKTFLDLWLSARWMDFANPSTPQPRLGLLIVLSLANDGRLQVVQLDPYKPGGGVGPTIPLTQENSFGKQLAVKLETLLLQSLVNSRLDAFNPQLGLKGLAGIRMLGNRGQRAPGEILAEALAIDLKVQ